MPNIRPISELRYHFAELSKMAHESGEPIYLTKNGYGDLVIMSIEAFEALLEKAEVSSEAETEPAPAPENARAGAENT